MLFQDNFDQESINNDADSDTTSNVANFDLIPNQQPPKKHSKKYLKMMFNNF